MKRLDDKGGTWRLPKQIQGEEKEDCLAVTVHRMFGGYLWGWGIRRSRGRSPLCIRGGVQDESRHERFSFSSAKKLKVRGQGRGGGGESKFSKHILSVGGAA